MLIFYFCVSAKIVAAGFVRLCEFCSAFRPRLLLFMSYERSDRLRPNLLCVSLLDCIFFAKLLMLIFCFFVSVKIVVAGFCSFM